MSHTECSGGSRFNKRNPCALAHVQSQISPLKNPWFALRATKEKTARLGDNFIEKSELERFFEFARTYFNTKHKAQPRRQRGQARCQCPDKTKNPLIFLRFSPTNFFFES